MWLTCSAPADKHAWKYTSFSFSSQDKNVHCRGVGNTAREEKKKIKIMRGLATKGRPLLMFCSVFFGLLCEPQSLSWREALASASPLLSSNVLFHALVFNHERRKCSPWKTWRNRRVEREKGNRCMCAIQRAGFLVSTHVPLAFLCVRASTCTEFTNTRIYPQILGPFLFSHQHYGHFPGIKSPLQTSFESLAL